MPDLQPPSALLVSLAMVISAPAGAASEPVRTDHLRSQLVAESSVAVPGQPLRIGLRLEHDPHWHTYWRNPGDSGLPTRIELELSPGVVAGDIEWPAPQRFDVAGIVNFGFGDTVLLPITLQLPPGLAGEAIQIRARASWLVCEVECIPGGAEYGLRIPLGNAASVDPRWQDDFAAARAASPQPLPGSAALSFPDDSVRIDIRSDALPPDIAAWEVFPATAQVVVNGAYPTWSRIDGGLRMRLPRSEYFVTAPARLPLVLVKGDQALSVDALVTPAGE